jgi:hypothetical protein
MVDRKVVPFDEFYYQLKLMYLFLLHIVYYATRFINGTLDTSFIRQERNVAERVFHKRVSKEVYKTSCILYYFYDQMNNANITYNFFIQR